MDGYCSDTTRCVYTGPVPADVAGAYAISIVLALMAVLVLVAMTVIRPKEEAA